MALAATAVVGPGTWRPLYPASPDDALVPVSAFALDETPVTEGEFDAFVRDRPEWSRERVPRVFADEGYLAGGDPDAHPDAPVTRISWFAARAYCTWRGERLPTTAEWELALAGRDGVMDASEVARALQFYEAAVPPVLPDVDSGAPNDWGVRDLDGLVWEWVSDFGSSMVDPGDGRFCGGGSLGASDVTDYAAFMRTAFRSSLRADYTTPSLGFRCAADLESR
jgi:formylglycine-generating enzyme required for sulfatase activity